MMKNKILAIFGIQSDSTNLWHADGFPNRIMLIFRIFLSLLMMRHGFQKLENLLSGAEIQFYNFLCLGPKISLALCVLGEFVAPIWIILGYRTRLAANLVWFTMAVASYGALLGHPIEEKELSLLYFMAFATISAIGPGKYSLDFWLSSKK